MRAGPEPTVAALVARPAEGRVRGHARARPHAMKATRPGRSRRKSPVPPAEAVPPDSASPRATPTMTTASAPSASRSTGLRPARPERARPLRTAPNRIAAAAAARARPSARPLAESAELPRISLTGDPARRATKAPIPRPTIHPIVAPANASPADSAAVSSSSCQRRAPNHVSRVLAADTSRRSLVAARAAKASRSAAASPPMSRSRRPETLDSSRAAASSSSGAFNSQALAIVLAWSSERAALTLPSSSVMSHGCTAFGSIGRIQP